MKNKLVSFKDVLSYVSKGKNTNLANIDMSSLKSVFTSSSILRGNLVNPRLSEVEIVHRESGLSCKLSEKSIINAMLSLGNLENSVLFIPVRLKNNSEQQEHGIVRYDCLTKRYTNVLGANEGYVPEIVSDIVIRGQSLYNNMERIIKSNNGVLDLHGFSFLDIDYGNNLKLSTLFSNARKDDKPKFSMVKFKLQDDIWGTVTLKSSKDFDTFLDGVSENPIFEILSKRLKLLQEKTDFEFLGYN